MLFKQVKISLLSALLVLTSIVLPSAPVYADEVSTEETTTALSLRISPASVKVELDPGKTYTGKVRVYNAGTDSFKYKTSVTPYQVSGENYTVEYEVSNTYTEITNWITLNTTTGNLAAKSGIDIEYTIKVPEDTSNFPPGQYATISVDAIPESENGSMFKAVGSVAMVIYGHLKNSSINECADILSNKVSPIMFSPPLTATATIKNCGNIDGEATYSIRVNDLFSGKELYASDSKNNIIPESTRSLTNIWRNSPSFGFYNVEQSVSIFGNTNVVRRLVFICPIWLIVLVLIFIVAVIFWIVSNHYRSRVKDPTLIKVQENNKRRKNA